MFPEGQRTDRSLRKAEHDNGSSQASVLLSDNSLRIPWEKCLQDRDTTILAKTHRTSVNHSWMPYFLLVPKSSTGPLRNLWE